MIEQLDEIEPTPCPCGLAKRAFAGEPGAVASLHEVDIKQDSEVHYHKRMTEIYLVLEGEGHLELDGELCQYADDHGLHQAGLPASGSGRLKIINIPVPAFDPEDEWFDA